MSPTEKQAYAAISNVALQLNQTVTDLKASVDELNQTIQSLLAAERRREERARARARKRRRAAG